VLAPLERLETKKAGETSLWVAPIHQRDLRPNNRQAFLYKKPFNPARHKLHTAAMPGNELNVNEGLMLLER
jgi:hypothetical protein